jgi:hypothetical protein
MNPMELSPFWKATNCPATPEFPNILWNCMVLLSHADGSVYNYFAIPEEQCELFFFVCVWSHCDSLCGQEVKSC